MRQIKFRAKKTTNDVWVYGSLVYSNDLDAAIYFQKGNGSVKSMDWVYVKPETIGQFTGLRDKNGKEIYEGDILRVSEYENLLMKEFSDDEERFDLFTLEEIRGKLKDEYVSPVVFYEGGFQISTRDNDFNMWLACLFGDMKRSSPSFEFEVIGNIHDNPELINK